MNRDFWLFMGLVVVLASGCQPRQPKAPQQVQPSLTTTAEPVARAGEPAANAPRLGITQQDLDRIEAKLKIRLPAEFRQFMPARREEILSYTFPLRGETNHFLDHEFFLDADRLISENLQQREPDWAAAEAFPLWWREYFLFGTNGGGDYYALRLDGQGSVWFLDCDGGEIRKYADSLENYLARCLEDYPQEVEEYKRLEEVWQQKEKGEISQAEFEKKWQAILDEP